MADVAFHDVDRFVENLVDGQCDGAVDGLDTFLGRIGLLSHEQFQHTVAMQLQQAPVSEELAAAITNFVSGLSELTVSASLPEGKTMMEINQQIMALMGQPEELASYINLQASGK